MSHGDGRNVGRPPDDDGTQKISISSITGHKWDQDITDHETADSLRAKIWQRTGLFPYHQGLIFGDLSLSEVRGQTYLRDLGIRDGSSVRLAIITRSGPLAVSNPDKITSPCSSKSEKSKGGHCDVSRVFDEKNLEKNRGNLFSMRELRWHLKENATAKPVMSDSDIQVFSAPEDTSAKESSAGDTECDDDKSCFCISVSSSAKISEFATSSVSKIKRNRQNFSKEEMSHVYHGESVNSSARDRLLTMMQTRTVSPATDINTHSEDGSEFSSGMVICDLSNEFRRLRVRRRHHGVGNGSTTVQRGRARSKPRIPVTAFYHQNQGSDVTSSDDERPRRRVTEPNFSYSTLRRSSAVSRTQKVFSGYQSQQRCSTCAVKLSGFSVAFQCRCGKTLCARHRPAEMHTCTRFRKLQDVSD